MPRKKISLSKKSYPGRIRIVSGIWRNRFLKVPNIENLRPTSERARETLFNWLIHDIPNARCLDLFAGTGSLGFEALSRGAYSVTFIEKIKQAAHLITETAKLFGLKDQVVNNQDALSFLGGENDQLYDIVFLDPPFSDNILSEVIELLYRGNWLSKDAMVYIELDIDQKFPELPSGWYVSHKKIFSKVCFALINFS